MKRLTINRIASASLRTNKRAYAALAVGIFLSIFFVTAMCVGMYGLYARDEIRRDELFGSQDAFWLDCEETDEALMSTGLYREIGHVYIPAVHKASDSAVGYYDEMASEALNRVFIEGRMPQQPGEIAMEESTLARLRLEDAGVGSSLTLALTPVDGAEEVRTFTLVGIMENQSVNMRGYYSFDSADQYFPAMRIHPEDGTFATGRMVQHKLFRFAAGVSGYQVLEYYHHDNMYGHVRVFDSNDQPTNYPSDLLTPNPALLVYSMCIALLVGTLLLATCVGIAGAMEGQLNRKTSQIGMLRAVGATRRQIRRIFGREALLLALLVAPLAVAAGCGTGWLMERIAPDLFVFRVKAWLLIPILLLSVAVVLLSGWLPLRRASRTMPASVMRDTEMLRRMKNIRSRKVYRPANLVAWRQLWVRPARQIAPAVLMCLLFVIVSLTVNVVSSMNTGSMLTAVERPSFSLWGSISYTSEFYDLTSALPLNSSDLAQIRSLPGVKRAEVNSKIWVAQELGKELPEYWKPHYVERSLNGQVFNHKIGLGDDVLLPAEQRPDGIVAADAEYDALRKALGVEGHLGTGLELNVTAINPEELAKYVVSGSIDLQAINAGQQVLVVAQNLYVFEDEEGNLNEYSGNSDDRWLKNRLNRPGYKLLYTLENDAYAPGQELNLHYLHTTEMLSEEALKADAVSAYEQIPHEKATVTVGAVLAKGYAIRSNSVGIITTEQGLQAMGFPDTRLSQILIYTDELSYEEEAELERKLTSIALRGTGYEMANELSAKREGQQERLQSLLLLSGVSVVLLCICIAQMTGSISRRIGSEVRMLGTLRAVGADNRVIFRIYSGQVSISVLIGTVLGMLMYWLGMTHVLNTAYLTDLWKGITFAMQLVFSLLTLGMSLLILHRRIRDVTCRTIIDNIREL